MRVHMVHCHVVCLASWCAVTGATPFDIMMGKREHVRMAQDFGQVEWDKARMAAPEKYEQAVFEETLLSMGTGLEAARVLYL
jgi:hypothetical protein